MTTVLARIAGDHGPAHCQAKVVAWVESFTGAPRPGDILMVMSRNPDITSRFGQAVFLRDEIDAGAIHWLIPSPPEGPARLLTKLARAPLLLLRLDEGARLSGALTGVDATSETMLVAVDPAAVDALRAAANPRGLRLSRVGEFGREPEAIGGRPRPFTAGRAKAAFRARRLPSRSARPA